MIGDVNNTAMALEAYPEAYPCGSRRELIGGEITLSAFCFCARFKL